MVKKKYRTLDDFIRENMSKEEFEIYQKGKEALFSLSKNDIKRLYSLTEDKAIRCLREKFLLDNATAKDILDIVREPLRDKKLKSKQITKEKKDELV